MSERMGPVLKSADDLIVHDKHLPECAVRMFPDEAMICTCRDDSPEWTI